MATKSNPGVTALMISGAALIVLGALAIATPAIAGKAVVMVIGGVLLVVGVVQFVTGLRAESWSQKLPPMILGALAGFCGLGLFSEPWIGMSFIALLMAVFFVIEGIWKIVTSFSYRPASGWILMLLSGVAALVLGGMIWFEWPLSGLWAVGILVGVDLLTTGASLMALASTIRRVQQEAKAK